MLVATAHKAWEAGGLLLAHDSSTSVQLSHGGACLKQAWHGRACMHDSVFTAHTLERGLKPNQKAIARAETSGMVRMHGKAAFQAIMGKGSAPILVMEASLADVHVAQQGCKWGESCVRLNTTGPLDVKVWLGATYNRLVRATLTCMIGAMWEA